MKILIGGDICPINSNENHFKSSSRIFGEFQELINESDLNIVNLEAPLTNASTKILKSGANIKGSVDAAESLKKSNVHLLSLANNHMGDFSTDGIADTLDLCKNNRIKSVGAGLDIFEAKKPVIINGKKKVGVLSFSDIEFGIANKNKAGVNPLDLCDLTLELINLKKKVDYSIVLLHEGKEHYAYPSPQLQKICRYICDIGADLVVCQHSHISGAWEEYKNCNIFYGQGNLMFDFANRNSESWKTGFLIQIELQKDGAKNIRQIPFRQSFPGINRLSRKEEAQFHQQSREMKSQVSNEDFIHESWQRHISRYRLIYYSVFRGYGKVFRKLNNIFGFTNQLYSKRKKAILLNVIRSRVHREIIMDILEKEISSAK